MTLLLFLYAPPAVRAQLSKQDQEAAKRMIAGTLYLRLDVPLRARMTGPEAVLEVSPTGHDGTRRLRFPTTDAWGEVGEVNWAFYPNYPVQYGKLLPNGDTVGVWLEGVEPYKKELIIDFVQIRTLDDFTKAFNQTFSKVPLQDEHPEWPAEVRTAIAERKVVVGMTKEQAFDVVGTPLEINTEEVNGVPVETWYPRKDRGKDFSKPRGFDEDLGPTGFPALLKFVDGKLQAIG
jgi:hypothetical protein